jgi:hypothetical protein
MKPVAVINPDDTVFMHANFLEKDGMEDANFTHNVANLFHGERNIMKPMMSNDRLTEDTCKQQHSGTLAGAAHTAAERIHKSADNLREKSTTSNAVANRIAGNAASAMDQAAAYIDEFSKVRLRHDISALVRNRPLQSMAVGVLFGFLAAKLLRK